MWWNWICFCERLILFCFENIFLSYALSCDFYLCLDLSVVLGQRYKITRAPRISYRFCITEWDQFVICNGFIKLFNVHLCKYTCILRNNNISDNLTYFVSIPNRCGIKPKNLLCTTLTKAEKLNFEGRKRNFEILNSCLLIRWVN